MRYILALLIVAFAVYLYVVTDDARTPLESGQTLVGIALGSLPSLIACFFIPLALAAALGTRHAALNAVGYTIGIIIYEFLQYLIPQGSFDPFDVVFSLMGLLLFLLLLYLLKAGGKVRD